MHIAASYNLALLNKAKRERAVDECAKRLSRIRQTQDFYALAVTGTSGILGALVAHRMDLDLITVRGRDARAHSHRAAEGNFQWGNYVIFDDQIDSGETVLRVHRAVIKAVEEHNDAVAFSSLADDNETYMPTYLGGFATKPRPIGVFTYSQQPWCASANEMFNAFLKGKDELPQLWHKGFHYRAER